MKQLITITLLFLLLTKVSAQQGTCIPPYYFFNNMTRVSGTGSGGVNTVYKFSNVVTGVDAYMTITQMQNVKNMTDGNMDAVGSGGAFAYAWQPVITFGNGANSSNSESFMEFKIEFKRGAALDNQSCLAMTIIDCDGPGGLNPQFRERIKSSLPASIKGVTGSLITVTNDNSWYTFTSPAVQFDNIDTIPTHWPAMAQITYPVISSYTMRVGVVGIVSNNSTREFSFYFKAFSGLTAPLPVTLLNFGAEIAGNDGIVKWSTTDEIDFNRFEIYRSYDGVDFELAGSMKAAGLNAAQFNNYSFIDRGVGFSRQAGVYYRLKLIDNNEKAYWNNAIYVKLGTLSGHAGLTSVYPNPAKTSLNVDMGYTPDSDFSVEIVDAYGKAVYTSANPPINGTLLTMDINHLERGLYFVHILNSDGSVYSNKFLKN